MTGSVDNYLRQRRQEKTMECLECLECLVRGSWKCCVVGVVPRIGRQADDRRGPRKEAGRQRDGITETKPCLLLRWRSGESQPEITRFSRLNRRQFSSAQLSAAMKPRAGESRREAKRR